MLALMIILTNIMWNNVKNTGCLLGYLINLNVMSVITGLWYWLILIVNWLNVYRYLKMDKRDLMRIVSIICMIINWEKKYAMFVKKDIIKKKMISVIWFKKAIELAFVDSIIMIKIVIGIHVVNVRIIIFRWMDFKIVWVVLLLW